ncbi:MAG: HNH endonuclease signature motif containing protein, partial [Candidatus Zixiibacteriota bacterium]
IRKIIADIYKGRCQLTDFSFLMKNGEPYFEIHHIRPNYGHHLKNLVVVCPNIHAQFEYANVKEHFDKEDWLRRVEFNSQSYIVRQFIDSVKLKFVKQVHYLK